MMPASAAGFPYLGTELNAVEDIAYPRLSCWLHCLRDSLYAAGVRDTARALAQPLNFVVERTPTGELLTLYGGQDTDYHAPRFQRGVTARWETSPDDPDRPDTALDLVRRELARGHAVPVSPELSGMRHSEYYRIPFFGYPHTLLVHRLEAGRAFVADRNTRKGSGFEDNRGTIGLAELRAGMAGAPVLVWDAHEPQADWESELGRLLERSVRQMTEPVEAQAGLAGLLDLPGVIEELAEAGERRSLLRTRVSGPLQRHVSGDRHLLARVLADDALLRSRGARTAALAADTAELLGRSSDAVLDLARAVFLLAGSWSAETLELCRRRVRELHTVETRVVDGLAGLC
ncbi:hypothetical protein [Streptomyces antarcticus]|uniref:hypothetical protein n=1 Tax=Streptomyces antarcticus TaxID=2996458 RepID=UPI00226EB11C|nr:MULTISPECIES: hypothetical protein [unclassified Streptomyces]MCY0942958.1 hypothetical protein [Streptomyces sp. H34-AA3]MCZ4083082.1 hypothetical protein [Streptomyces sp. H34-S5]